MKFNPVRVGAATLVLLLLSPAGMWVQIAGCLAVLIFWPDRARKKEDDESPA